MAEYRPVLAVALGASIALSLLSTVLAASVNVKDNFASSPDNEDNDVFLTYEQRMANDQRAATHPCDNLTGNYQTWKSSAKAAGVVVVGGGVAGLQAVKTLIQKGVTDVLLLEAENQLGGRVRTVRSGNVLVEEGAEWIHGGPTNPLYGIAQNLSAFATKIPDSAWDWRVRKNTGQAADTTGYDVVMSLIDSVETNGALLPYYDIGYGQFYIDKFPGAYGTGWNTTMGRAWLYLLQKLTNGEEGTNNWLDMSGRDADAFVSYGADNQWKNGYDTLINELKKTIPVDKIRVSSPVCKIYWNETDSKVLLVTNGGNTSYSANYVIMTPSVGHMKERHQQLFQPALPASYVKNLNGIELGAADKIIMGWNNTWWGTQKPLDLYILWTTFNLPQEMAWLYGVAEVFGVNQQLNVIETIITGNEAKQMENLPEETVKQHFRQLLSNTTGLPVPEPTFFKRSQWCLNPWKRGAFSSYITVAGNKAGLLSRNQLAVPLKNSKGKNVVFWAGEHTHNTRYSTVDGALKTGENQALKLVNIMAG